jgi:glycosyltransferase involved in cell wall biosynthesis
MPSVSIVIPTYNCGRYLAQSLESVIRQAGPDGEIIVADDGSTDDTPEILARYGEQIQVVRGGHRGLSEARNLGLERARGDWIAFHDADDIAMPDRLASQRNFLAAHPEAQAVFCNGERMDRPRQTVVPSPLARRLDGRRLTVRDVFEGFPIYFQGALVPRAAFTTSGPFDPSLRVQPDIEYAYRLLGRLAVWFVDRVVFSYRWHTTNNSNDRLGGREDIARILERLHADASPTLAAIGRTRLRRRLARHYFGIARARLRMGDREAAGRAAARAAELCPFNLRYQYLRARKAS